MMGLHQAVALCMDHCQAAKETEENDRWFKTVVLAGGTACLPGLPGTSHTLKLLIRASNILLVLFLFSCMSNKWEGRP